MNILLLIVSLVVIASFGFESLIFILFSTITTYIAARNLKSKYKKLILISTIFVNTITLLLVRFNGANLLEIKWLNLLALFGISYYTLLVISYIVDVYKGKYEPEKKLFKYALYVTYIPQLFMGPISKYDEIRDQLSEKRKLTLNNLYEGSLRIVWGLLKTLVISGRLAVVTSVIAGYTGTYVGCYAFLAMILYSIQLYCNFSGGIDIVLGISKILGIKLTENFDMPFFSENIKEFWRRWHISLGRWLKEYIYVPLGGNRCGNFRKCINLLITFTVSGLWHGVHYILWGIGHGIFVMIGDKGKTKYKWLNRTVTFLIVSFLWSFFIWPDTLTALKMIGGVFTNFNITAVAGNITSLGLALSDWIIVIVFTAILFVFDANKTKISEKIKSGSPELKTTLICTLILVVFVFGVYGFGFNVNEFIYSKF